MAKGGAFLVTWNLWHGCHKISEGCRNCYMYRMDARFERDSSKVTKTGSFDLPLRRDRSGAYKIAPGSVVATCFSSDFLVEDADPWRAEAWAMMAQRSDLHFLFLTKRIQRLSQCLPPDWGEGYENVTVGCTVENQARADERLPVFLSLPIRRRVIVCEPLLGAVDLSAYLSNTVQEVIAGGESGEQARVCDYRWVLDLRRQCEQAGVTFTFKQTGARLLKDGRIYRVRRPFQHEQARKAGIDWRP